MHFKCLDNSNRADVVILTVPYTVTNLPLMAPASLKPSIERAGLTSLCSDLNAEVAPLVERHPYKEKLVECFFQGTEHPDIIDWVDSVISSAAVQILTLKPQYVGLSLFTWASRYFCRRLCRYIKNLNPEIKIILGGVGCLEQFTGPALYAEELMELGLADYYIRGDGENALYELLTGNTSYPGINSTTWKQISGEELEKLPYPNYDDYDFSKYAQKSIGLQGSRGCVRKCTFCDFIANWTNFQYRSAENIFEEMQYQYQKYGIRKFKFHDSLTNGNLKEFNKLIRMMARHNKKNKRNVDAQFSWVGYYIFREQSAHDEETWELIARSGADFLIVGIENLNEDIRYHIGKKFSNTSIDYHLAMAKKHRIRLTLLFIVGYVTETQAHVDFSKKWLEDHVEYKDNISILWDATLAIFPNTHLIRNKESLGIQLLGPNPQLWINPSTGNHLAQRRQWVDELNQKSLELGYELVGKVDNHFLLEQMLAKKRLTN